jgi:hypothetical protein
VSATLSEVNTEALARDVYAALELGEDDARMLDGERHKPAKWERARAALFELVRRLEASS